MITYLNTPIGANPTHEARWKKAFNKWCAKVDQSVHHGVVLRIIALDGRESFCFAKTEILPGIWTVGSEKEVDLAFSDVDSDDSWDFDPSQG